MARVLSPPLLSEKLVVKKRTIAPRLASGDRRIANSHGIPPHIKDGLKLIARRENKSVSWVLEELIYDHLGLRRPKFIKRKVN